MKRFCDALIAFLALVLLSPVLMLIAIAVFLSDPGPPVFRGRRIGRGGREFLILKFRSMRRKAPAERDVTVRNDPRVTPVGRLLRSAKLDELPQLLNVLWGDMSLVGPRPESPRYVALYTPEQRRVLDARPGLTGLSQLYFRSEERLLAGPNPERYYEREVMPVKLAIDRYYVEHRTLWMDLKIVLLTVIALVRPVTPPAFEPFALIQRLEAPEMRRGESPATAR